MGLISDLSKNWKLMRLMKRIGVECSASQLAKMVVSQGLTDIELAERELFNLVFSDPDLCRIIESYNASHEDIEGYYHRLSATGAGKWVGGSYVSVAAIAIKPALIYLLEAVNRPLPDGWNENDRWIRIVNELVLYFKSGRLVLQRY